MNTQIIRRQPVGGMLSSSLHPVIDKIYRNRGVTQLEDVNTQAKCLLHFKSLSGIQKAVELLIDAIAKQRRIVIVGDFDADGATSTALCMLALKSFGAKSLSYLVPNRFDFGYGLSPQIVDVAHQDAADLIITVDSGIACLEGVAHAKALGLDVIVTDHHLPPATLPDADAIVNPNLADCAFPSKNLAGVGVAFYLLSALRSAMADRGLLSKTQPPPSMAQWLDIVAVGTVADVVKLDSNNRILVHQGLQRIRAGKCRPGIKAILDIANRQPDNLTASDLGFVVGPRLNAAGRLDDMSTGIECLLADDIYLARQMAADLDSLNQQRKQIEKTMKQEAEQLAEALIAEQSGEVPSALVFHHSAFHQGIIGIVAGRMKDRFNRPVIAFADAGDGKIKGSARSVEGIHIRDALEDLNRESPELIDKFGGHAMAAGLTINLSNLERFNQRFMQVIARLGVDLDSDKRVYTDGPLPLDCLTLDFVRLLYASGPYGQGFPAPAFDDQFTLISQRIVGENHLKMTLEHTNGQHLEAIAFNIDLDVWPNNQVSQIKGVYKPEINVFRGKQSLQLVFDYMEACV
ncbi:single-stranded-DNA-specific exonuclease RecJ [Alteromonas sediminis]|uniref:Single-stranded-DNA-specific exonuclease RecJ n=1 Tax=Alteromonas sediminis TaxID=2259342 RepID=A0A3N5XXZ8_9ALTE|nr:single-stranded-DNA-specific exonuclease RecJ [Alteromonas sediminis]RPJ65752.1 single-stranded-DNA-specific exonuclease RecJ [Alteromonas sediminis]